MVAARMPPNAGDIAWFIRDLSIDYPNRPSFQRYGDGESEAEGS